MYVLLETLNLEIILGHLGKKLFYSFKKFLHSWEILFSTTPRMSGHTKQDILWLPEWLIIFTDKETHWYLWGAI